MVCLPAFYDVIRKYINLYLMCSDINLLRTNFFTTAFIAIPVYLLFEGANMTLQIKEQLDFCSEENFAKLFAKLICTAPVVFPFIFSFYMQTLNE